MIFLKAPELVNIPQANAGVPNMPDPVSHNDVVVDNQRMMGQLQNGQETQQGKLIF